MSLLNRHRGKSSIDVEGREATPVQVEESRVEGMKVGFNLPLAQALATAVSATFLVASLVVTIRALGGIFWVGALIVGVTTLLWYLIQAMRWENGVTILDVFVALGLSMLTGWTFYCAHRVSSDMVPDWPIEGPLGNLMVSLTPVFFGALTGLLGLAFVQELAQRSPFQEQFVWKVLSEILGQKYLKPGGPRSPMVIHGSKPKPDTPTNVEPVQRENEYSPELLQALDLRGFLTIGNNTGFSRTKMVHKILPSGAEITDPSWRRDTGLLKGSGILTDNGGGTRLAVSLREALSRVEIPEE